MPKPSNYDDLTNAEKWDLCLALLQSPRGQSLLDQAFDWAGKELQEERRRFPEDNTSERAILFKMVVARQALEVAIGALTMQPQPDWTDIQDMEILYNGLTIQIRYAAGDISYDD